MNMVDIILKKRSGEELTENEIRSVIKGYVDGSVADYQMSALLMAVYFQGLTDKEIFVLTDAMKNSGSVLDLSDIKGIKVDKHSSGGVGDKITLIIGPIVAAAGVKVAKMSGRGLGFTGGTIDKLAAIPGFTTDLSIDKFKRIVKDVGLCVAGQTENIAKADKLIYALRDVTGTVDIKGLIASSIMSKKLAMGSDAILLDVKYGMGALMKTKQEAKELAELMKRIGNMASKNVEYILSDMNQPLGNMVGNANEVMEAIDVLKGKGPDDLMNLAIEISGKMLVLGELAKDKEEGAKIAKSMVDNKKALLKCKEFIEAQGGNPSVVEDYSLLPKPKYEVNVKIAQSGILSRLEANKVGEASLICGAGREKKEDDIDLSAGITLFKKVGDEILEDEVVAKVYGNDKDKLVKAVDILIEAYTIAK